MEAIDVQAIFITQKTSSGCWSLKCHRGAERAQNKFKVHVPIGRRTDKAAHMPLHGNKARSLTGQGDIAPPAMLAFASLIQ
ncbi:hypothetical protein JTB14_025978 [Gonioctena quinquepunctata]|nr:hypothetical protein JTB14_025978 [Gonioctena quinquepunctata]